jgi:PAS domain-containing protein
MKRLTTLFRTLRTAKGPIAGSPEPGMSIAQLYDASPEATLIIDATNGTVIEANPASAELLGRSLERLVGGPWLAAFSATSVLALTKLESVAHAAGIAAPIRAVLRDSEREVDVALSLVRALPAQYMLAHVTPAGGFPAPSAAADSAGAASEFLARAADGFVVTEPGLRILYANQAFARLVGLRAAGDVIGKSLTRWVGFNQDDLTTLTRQMETREAVSAIRTSLKPSPSKAPARTVELTAVAVPDEPQRCFGFWVKDHGDRGPADADDPAHRQAD